MAVALVAAAAIVAYAHSTNETVLAGVAAGLGPGSELENDKNWHLALTQHKADGKGGKIAANAPVSDALKKLEKQAEEEMHIEHDSFGERLKKGDAEDAGKGH
jgi:hypothetical protein